ncbi:hypothetical protein E4T38_01079 [Aureobasidium subglaciale]|nr:hypothetical protein E4T38_01079 [Aureobasidium subglaciale]KAI5230797.1 hypothetical protein E4T40_01080 [Aureobasidium subglaciale]KAI5233963.1 hypothetical protein E4T41_01078 [Aureobasidium subglaciale]KAI5267226.1 hypothetical protein E4T46_01078 [Aureobasidium subglaciale]
MTAASSRTYWNAGMVNRAHGNGKISGVFVFNTESMKITRRIFVTFVARIYTVHPRVWPDLFIHKRYWTYGFWVIGKFAKTQDTANINLILVNDCGIYVESKSKKLGPDVYIGLCRFTLAWSSSRAYVVGSAWFEMAELLRALVLQKEAHRFPERLLQVLQGKNHIFFVVPSSTTCLVPRDKDTHASPSAVITAESTIHQRRQYHCISYGSTSTAERTLVSRPTSATLSSCFWVLCRLQGKKKKKKKKKK